jgi:hypothetical protein
LFVAPNYRRERELHQVIGPLLPSHVNLCRFWTGSLETVASVGWLGAVWLEIKGSPHRLALADMPGVPRGEGLAGDCVGKPRWWKHRLAGGEGA